MTLPVLDYTYAFAYSVDIFLLYFHFSISHCSDCKYPDPMVGCSPGFQARMSEIIQHELDTVKWEKGKKGKKKSSSGWQKWIEH